MSVGAAVAMVFYVTWKDLQWTPIQIILATWMAFDIVGAIVTNATSAAKRWYRGEGQEFREYFGLIAFRRLD
jgi:hypothetical protein